MPPAINKTVTDKDIYRSKGQGH